MDDKFNMTAVFEKLNDLRVLFEYAQKIVPILQSLADFMNDTVPLLEQINHSIADSTSKIPKASNQISDVTSATELATTEILDLVDTISNRLNQVETEVKAISQVELKKAELLSKLENLLNDNSEAKEIISQFKDLNSVKGSIEKINSIFPEIMNDTYSITLSLQVQDITSQQLAAVNHLIQSVQQRLASIIEDIDTSHLNNDYKLDAPDGATFDPNASYDKSASRQDMADSIMNGTNQKASQDEIDKLFL